MHHCLTVVELVVEIFSHLNAEPRYLATEDSKALAALARCCTLFHGPALDILWRKQDNFLKILRCLPSDLVSINFQSGVKLLRPIKSSDWTRALLYMARLTCLHWYSIDDFRYFPLFITSALTSVIATCHPSQSNLSLLMNSRLNYRAMRRFELGLLRTKENNYDDPVLDASSAVTVSTIVYQLLAVESVSILLPDLATLEHLGRVETLKILHLDSLPVRMLFHTLQGPLFFNLSELIIGVSHIDAATTFAALCSESAFTLVKFAFATCPTAKTAARLCTALALCGRSHSSLRSFYIHSSSDPQPDLDPLIFAFPNDAIQKLFCFRNLTDIHIMAPCGYALDDMFCAQIACA
ncbi:hypothetical protein C8R43DRAFT_1235141 [Mycena crocata]|nr:hypothetical protein C8R43DRAFT_1235141 [Mycena crocata]